MKKFFLFTLPFFIAHSAEAACVIPGQYELLVPIGTLSGCVDLATYVKGMFETIIGLAGILAVVMIVYCGIKLMTSGSAGGKTEAKTCITNALFGVLLAVGSWLILNTINPLFLVAKPSVGIPVVGLNPSTAVAIPSGTLVWQPGPSCPAVAGNLVTTAPPSQCAGVQPPGTICCQYLPVTLPTPVASPVIPPAPPIIGSPPTPPVNGQVWVDGATIFVDEAVGTVSVIVHRSGSGAGTVDYAALNGTATVGADFGAIAGTLNFPLGVNQLTVVIPIVDDALAEGTENFYLTLSNAGGALALGNPFRREISIADNEIAPPDITPPVVSILFPLNAIGLVTTSPSISARVSVTEETKLAKVDLFSIRASTSIKLVTSSACGTAPVCPPLGGVFDLTSGVGPIINEYFNLVARGCDTAGNCGYATTTIGFTSDCKVSSATTSYRCFTLPTGVGATSSPTVPGRTNAHLIKLTSPSGGGTIAISTISPTFDWYGENCTDMWGNTMWCGYGCAAPTYDTCNLVPTVPLCGGLLCPYGCAVDRWTASCNLVPPVPMCGGLSCPSGCAVSPDIPVCFVPEPVIVASLATLPQDLSRPFPCGNGGSFPGAMNLNITFGTSTAPGVCTLKPFFNYFLNITASDGKPHNFQVNYNWLP